jgi:hypothetical protein
MVLEQNCESYLQKYHLAVMITASPPSVSKWDRPRSIAGVAGHGRSITSNRKKQLIKLFILSQETLRSVRKNKSYKKTTIAAEWNYKNLIKNDQTHRHGSNGDEHSTTTNGELETPSQGADSAPIRAQFGGAKQNLQQKQVWRNISCNTADNDAPHPELIYSRCTQRNLPSGGSYEPPEADEDTRLAMAQFGGAWR